MNHDKPEPAAASEERMQTRSIATLLILGLTACILFAGFIALGSWQVRRLSWKHDLIARVAQRVNAPATAIPPIEQWNNISAESDEYRHVQVSGVFQSQFNTKVIASTVFGRGFWLMTPLKTSDGTNVWINRGFIAFNSKPAPGQIVSVDPANASINVTGLLRVNEPGGGFLRHNHPDQQEWSTRDIVAMTGHHHLSVTAPFFIDAEAQPVPEACRAGQCSDHPIGGLTVTTFNDNHLAYSITWFALALMVAIAVYIVAKSEIKLRRKSSPGSDQRTQQINDATPSKG